MAAMRSSAGVGIVPPKVLGAPKPTSSVIINRMLGAPFGGTILAGQQGVDWAALRLMTPPNFWGAEGRDLVSRERVSVGAQGCWSRGCCWALAPPAEAISKTRAASQVLQCFNDEFMNHLHKVCLRDFHARAPLTKGAVFISGFFSKSGLTLGASIRNGRP